MCLVYYDINCKDPTEEEIDMSLTKLLKVNIASLILFLLWSWVNQHFPTVMP